MGLQKINKKKQRNKPFAPIEISTIESTAWQILNKMEAHVYNTLKTFYRGDNAIFTAPFRELKIRSLIKHGETLDKAIAGLEEKGWIIVERFAKHGKLRGLRVRANRYQLTFKYDHRRF